jgi:hypothetical protein
MFPFGHHPEPYPEFNHDVLAGTSEMLESFDDNSVVPDSSSASSAVADSSVASPAIPDSSMASSAIPDSTVASSAIPDSSVASSAIQDSSVASSAVPDSSVASSVVTESHRPSSVAHSHDDSQPRGKKTHSDSYSLNDIQLRYPQWQTILVRMRMLIRVAISTGDRGNPFLLTQGSSSDTKARFINDLFNQTLAELRISRKDLCIGQ